MQAITKRHSRPNKEKIIYLQHFLQLKKYKTIWFVKKNRIEILDQEINII